MPFGRSARRSRRTRREKQSPTTTSTPSSEGDYREDAGHLLPVGEEDRHTRRADCRCKPGLGRERGTGHTIYVHFPRV